MSHDEAGLHDTAGSCGQDDGVAVNFGRARVLIDGIHEGRSNDDQDIRNDIPWHVVTFFAHDASIDKTEEHEEEDKRQQSYGRIKRAVTLGELEEERYEVDRDEDRTSNLSRFKEHQDESAVAEVLYWK